VVACVCANAAHSASTTSASLIEPPSGANPVPARQHQLRAGLSRKRACCPRRAEECNRRTRVRCRAQILSKCTRGHFLGRRWATWRELHLSTCQDLEPVLRAARHASEAFWDRGGPCLLRRRHGELRCRRQALRDCAPGRCLGLRCSAGRAGALLWRAAACKRCAFCLERSRASRGGCRRCP